MHEAEGRAVMKLIRCERCGAEITGDTVYGVHARWREHYGVAHPGVTVHRAVVEDVAG